MLKVAQQQLKCIKNFTPLRIVTSNSSKNTEFFSVLNTNGEKIGNFKIAADQYVSDLEIEPKFRRTKTSANALLSIKEFVEGNTRAKGLDYFEFEVKPNNKHSLKKLYEHLGMDYIETLPNGNLLFIGVANKQDKANIIESFNEAIDGTFFDWKILETLKEFFTFTNKRTKNYDY